MFLEIILLNDFSLFVGRWHPVLVHLPIGFLLLAAVMQVLKRRPRFAGLDAAIPFALLIGAWSGVAAVICGWLLAGSGEYEGGTLFWHRWLGIAVTALAFGAWWMKRQDKSDRMVNYSMLGLAAGLLITGHLGGNMTHGDQYLLQYAPGFVRGLFGVERPGEGIVEAKVVDPDSVMVYTALVQPLLEDRCISCHNEDKSNGGLIMDTFEALMEGGDHGAAIVGGNIMESELLNRLALPQTDEQFMPPKGQPLTYDQVRLIEWWVSNGADPETSLSDIGVTPDIKTVLERSFGMIAEKRPFVETLKVDPAPAAELEKLKEAGWKVVPLAAGINLLEISAPDSLAPGQLEQLAGAAEQIVWLNLGDKDLNDDDVKALAQLPNLNRLRLEKNPLNDSGIAALTTLANLESLNLYGTQVTDGVLESIRRMPRLQRLYLWQTGVTEEAVETLRRERPGLEVDMGFQFAEKEEG